MRRTDHYTTTNYWQVNLIVVYDDFYIKGLPSDMNQECVIKVLSGVRGRAVERNLTRTRTVIPERFSKI